MTATPALPLFRHEALSHRNANALLGDVVLARPLSLALATGLACGLAVLIVVFLVAGSYTRKLPVTGHLAPDRGLVRVVAPQPGTVVRRLVADGANVAAGTPLIELSLERIDGNGQNTEAAIGLQARSKLASLQASLDNQSALLREQGAALRQRSLRLQDEKEHAQAQLGLARERVDIAAALLERYRDLAARQFVSELQLREKQQSLLELRFGMQDAERTLSAARRQSDEVQGELAALSMRQKELQLTHQREAAALGQEIAESEGRRGLVIQAPVAGIVTASLAAVGSAVAGGGSLLSIVPDGSALQAELYAPSSAIGFVRAGLPVRLRYRAFPYEIFGHQLGHVSAVSAAPIAPAELPPGLGSGHEPLFRIIVSLPAQQMQARGRGWPLAAGMALDADLLLEERRLLDWLLVPLSALRG